MTSNNVYTEEWRISDTLLSVVFLQYSASTAENTCFLKMYLSIFLLRFSKGPVSKLWSHWISSLSAVLLQRQFWSLTGFPLTGPACWSCRWQEEPAVLHFHLEHFEFDNWLIIKFLTSLADFFLCKPRSLSRSEFISSVTPHEAQSHLRVALNNHSFQRVAAEQPQRSNWP